MSKLPTPLEQMFEMALRNKNIKAARFTIEWAEFEEDYKAKPVNQEYIGEGKCNILV